jgi:exosortase/archaeosortase family protein
MSNILQNMNRKILYFGRIVAKNANIIIKLLPIVSFIIPLIILYYLYPSSFEETWKGRTYYLFFIWLIFLETILSWGELQTKRINKLKSIRTVSFIIAISLPTIYILIANFLGLNSVITHLYAQYMGPGYESWANLMPLSIEYLIFGTIFATTEMIMYGKRGLIDSSISTSLLFAIGIFYIIDNFYPYGRITLLQLPALPTTHLAANVLNLMGYQTKMSIETTPYHGWMPLLKAWVPNNIKRYAEFGIGWPCSGVESLIIFTITIILFLKKSAIPWKHRIIYFVIGAIITFFINVLRVATIFDIAIKNGWRPNYMPPEVSRFHDYYGSLYSIIWIIAYPLIIIGSRILWSKLEDKLQNSSSKGTDKLVKRIKVN